MAKKKTRETTKKNTAKDIKNLEAEIEEFKEEISELKKGLVKQRRRVDRIVKVLLNNLPERKLSKTIYFEGEGCNGRYRSETMSLKDFLWDIIDP